MSEVPLQSWDSRGARETRPAMASHRKECINRIKRKITIKTILGFRVQGLRGSALSVTWLATASLHGYLAHKKHPPPQDHHRSLGIGLLEGPTAGVFLMSEVPL